MMKDVKKRDSRVVCNLYKGEDGKMWCLRTRGNNHLERNTRVLFMICTSQCIGLKRSGLDEGQIGVEKRQRVRRSFGGNGRYPLIQLQHENQQGYKKMLMVSKHGTRIQVTLPGKYL